MSPVTASWFCLLLNVAVLHRKWRVDGSVLVSRQMNLNVEQAFAQVNDPRQLLWTAVSHRLLFQRKTCQINLTQKARRQVWLAWLVCSLSRDLEVSNRVWFNAVKHCYYTSDSLWKIWLVESIQSIHNSFWTWHDKCNICCRYCIYHVKFKVCLVTKPLGVFSPETKWLNASLLFLRMNYVKNV